jgi:uncharacterized coiled-coil protein SlyX
MVEGLPRANGSQKVLFLILGLVSTLIVAGVTTYEVRMASMRDRIGHLEVRVGQQVTPEEIRQQLATLERDAAQLKTWTARQEQDLERVRHNLLALYKEVHSRSPEAP